LRNWFNKIKKLKRYNKKAKNTSAELIFRGIALLSIKDQQKNDTINESKELLVDAKINLL
jgi:hypothetical protein